MSVKFLITLVLFIVLSGISVANETAISTPVPATASFSPLSEVDKIAPILIIPGPCGAYSRAFSPDDTLTVANYGVYEIPSGKLRFEISGILPQFSSDGTLVAVQSDSVYSVEDGHALFPILQESSFPPAFSPDGTLLAVADDGVYDVVTGQFLFPVYEGELIFSPDGTLLAAGYHSYDVKSGELFRSFDGHFSGFTPDGKLGLIAYDGLYDMQTGKKRFDIPDGSPMLSPDGRSFIVSGVGSANRILGVYDVIDGHLRFSTSDGYPEFSPDSSLLAIGSNGVYDVYSGALKFSISSYADFSSDGKLLAVSGDGVYEVSGGRLHFNITGDYPHFSPDSSLLAVNFFNGCVIYGEASRAVQKLPVTGTIYLKASVYIYSAPSNKANRSGWTYEKTNYLIFARTTDSQWFKIGDEEWVSAKYADVITMPDNLSVEDQ